MTGGSNGIGREICLELARCGCNVACLDVDLDAARKLCAELRELGVKASAYEVKRSLISNFGFLSLKVYFHKRKLVIHFRCRLT